MIHLTSHAPEWAANFSHEAAAIANALGSALVAIHHIGSTAIPGIAAKPVIDMLAVVHSLPALDTLAPQMRTLGYEVMGEFGIAGRRYYRKDNPAGTRTHQVHAFEQGSPQIARHIAFRDYLLQHPARAKQYETLKLQLAAAHPNDISRYTDGKDAFIREVDAQAAEYFAKTDSSISSANSR